MEGDMGKDTSLDDLARDGKEERRKFCTVQLSLPAQAKNQKW
jgi:hypothetical protein